MKWIKIIVNSLLLILIIGIGSLVALTGKKEFGGYRLFVVKSGSMAPAIPVGSLIVTQEQPEYQINDVITYGSVNRKDAIITHRIVEIKQNNDARYFITKGDANEINDDVMLPPASVLGKHIMTIPLVGYPIGFASTPVGAVVLIIIPATIILWEEVKNIRKILFPHKKAKTESV